MEGIPQQKQSPSDLPDDFDDVLANLKFQQKRSAGTFGTVENELMNMADGGTADGTREEYYPGWTDDHFKKLLEALSKK